MNAPCEFYKEIGSGCCDGCGKRPSEHKGMLTLRKGAGPFGGDADWERLTWAEWDERVAAGRREREAREALQTLPAETVIGLVEALRGGSRGEEA